MTSSVLERLIPAVSRPWILIAVLVWTLAVAVDVSATSEPPSPGDFTGTVTMRSDVLDGRYGQWAFAESEFGELNVTFDTEIEAVRGDRIVVEGEVRSGTLHVDQVIVIFSEGSQLSRVGTALRSAALDRLQPMDDGRALLAGFLIGDTTSVAPADVEAMRKSGLSHFVAVSGSNVALFLLLLAFVAGPLAIGPRRRAVVGLLGLPVYAAITRFEPSVLRASVMAGIALGGRLFGLILEAWQLLAVAVMALVLIDPSLTANIGFQLSVAATAGVIVGARWSARNWLTRTLAVTLGAQLFVAPLLLVHFGTVPLMSPIANLLTAPIVGLSTALGAVGMAIPVLIDVAAWLANLVLAISRHAAGWPQLGPIGLVSTVTMGLTGLFWNQVRPVLVVVAAGVVIAMSVPHGRPPAGSVVVLDVGQGDAILVHGGDGRFALIDGGPDSVVLEQKLREHGVTSIEVAVLSHVHADHATGLAGILVRMPVNRLITDTEPHRTEASEALFRKAEENGLVAEQVGRGSEISIGSVTLRFEGPIRRYASPNDQSVVVTAIGRSRTMLLSGDIETFAQTDLAHLRADVLKVPHQGAGTSDRDWLTSVGAGMAVISVGPNQFGHPVPWVIEVLESSGVTVVRTDVAGDVVVDLS